jgi:hypothetical protein
MVCFGGEINCSMMFGNSVPLYNSRSKIWGSELWLWVWFVWNVVVEYAVHVAAYRQAKDDDD